MNLKFQIFFVFLCFGNSAQESGEEFLLPDTSRPELYVLFITPNFSVDNRTFTGFLSLTVRIEKKTHEIFLHSREHKFNFFGLYDGSFPWTELPDIKLERENDDVIKVSSPQELLVGERYDLFLGYEGNLSLTSDGFFRSDYDENGDGNNEKT